MTVKKTLGGDRLGSGNKLQLRLHNYERSTHNLSRVWRSSMGAGILTPCFVEWGLNGDTFEIDIASKIRTLPTVGPAFASFKFQVDLFSCPVRLYQGLLHNNAVKIGMEMKNVKLPQINIDIPLLNKTHYDTEGEWRKQQIEKASFEPSSLMYQLGVKGIGLPAYNFPEGNTSYYRNLNAIPLLAYWDIFKNYYANKQEDNAYYITSKTVPINGTNQYVSIIAAEHGYLQQGNIEEPANGNKLEQNLYQTNTNKLAKWTFGNALYIKLGSSFTLNFPIGIKPRTEAITIAYISKTDNTVKQKKLSEMFPLAKYQQIGNTNQWYLRMNTIDLTSRDHPTLDALFNDATPGDAPDFNGYYVKFTGIFVQQETEESYYEDIQINNFPLENLDKMRQHILKMCGLGDRVVIDASLQGETDTATGQINIAPYNVCAMVENGDSLNTFPLNGMALKTYQSDLFNNWLNSEWIDGDNGIAAVSAVSTADGSFTMDALNLAQKVYNMLNRVAVAGGTYEDWQEAVFGQDAIRRAESPIYLGGSSMEIVFDEIVSTAESDTELSGNNPLGTLAGRGVAVNKKGGKIKIKVSEPTVIIGIASITPRLDYYQGNEWWTYAIESMEDFHKPAFDGIGFQNLIAEQMDWRTTTIQQNGIATQVAVGKQPAWINYMTSFNRVAGDFAKEEANFMVMTRDYHFDENQNKVTDFTTYINPKSVNKIFAIEKLAAQNFWVQIGFDTKARRKMSAAMIPNL